jgi:hypothetical protein
MLKELKIPDMSIAFPRGDSGSGLGQEVTLNRGGGCKALTGRQPVPSWICVRTLSPLGVASGEVVSENKSGFRFLLNDPSGSDAAPPASSMLGIDFLLSGLLSRWGDDPTADRLLAVLFLRDGDTLLGWDSPSDKDPVLSSHGVLAGGSVRGVRGGPLLCGCLTSPRVSSFNDRLCLGNIRCW